MVTASKKTIEKAQQTGDLFVIRNSEITEQENFGSFEVIKTKRGIMFKNYNGYHVWTTPYAVGTDGKAHETSLYSWLNELLKLKKAFAGHEEEKIIEDSEATKGDLLESARIATEANLIRPMVVFIDRDYAYQEAKRYIDWMKEQMEALQKAAETPAPGEDEKANAEFNAKVDAYETMQQMIQEEENAGESK